ncbi:hypothetical protein [Nocardia suismassiliense]|uniref:hypothetical protein n=1 Tax=Nocardia suismassiliense TaxID=2077092 RepID=UPI00131ED716|nr:hypothetical protein [Nocardia suismassiliense]
MSTVAESSIFASPESTPDPGGWPTREDVFAEDVGDPEAGESFTYGATYGQEDGDLEAENEVAYFEDAADRAADNEDAGYESAGYEAADSEDAEPEAADSEYGGYEASGYETTDPESAGYEYAGYEASGYEDAEPEAASYGYAGYEAADYENAEPAASGYENADYEASGDESAAYGAAGYESAGYEAADSEDADYEVGGYEEADYEDADYEDADYENADYENADYAEADYENADYEDPPPTPVTPGRLIVKRHPLLRTHAGTPPDLLVEWNGMVEPSVVDVVVHLHGYAGQGAAMNIVKHKKPISGLDFTDPAKPSVVGRTIPTLLILPRGHHQPKGNPARYTFPALTKPGALQRLIDDALARFGAATGTTVRRNRLILTAHSGGGAALMAILGHTDPDEVHTFDALYNDPKALITWARKRMAAGTGALRVLYRPGEGTARASKQVAAAVRGAASPNFRVERTRVPHNDIPRRFGWQLLADASADLRGGVLPGESSDELWTPQEGDGEYWGETSWEADDYLGESPSHECGCRGKEGESSEAPCPAKPSRRSLGKCRPAQDDCKPEAPWSEVQKRFRKRCSLTTHRLDPKSAIDCACAFGDPRDVAIFSMARVVAAGPLAARLFAHFLGASGTEVTIDVADMIKRSAGVREKIRKSMARGGSSGVTRIEQSEYRDSELQFAYGAIDCVQWRVLPPVAKDWRKKLGTRIEISMLDYYEFHPARPGVSQCAHAACVELVARGQAKNFWTSGSAVVTLADLGARAPAPAPARPRERRTRVYQNTY